MASARGGAARRVRDHVHRLLSAPPSRAGRSRRPDGTRDGNGVRIAVRSRTARAVTPSLEEVFGADGPFSKALPGYEPRAGQVQMAQLVERGIMEGLHTIVEAGTGVGKSLAYLAPAIRSGKKVVLSTGTIALQEQL